MPIELLKVGVLADTEWQGDLRLWAEHGGDLRILAADTKSNSYRFGNVRYQGMVPQRMDRYDEYPVAEVRGASFNARWVFTRVPDRWRGTHIFGWVQNVKRDVINVRYSTGTELVVPTAEWAPEGIRPNTIWYFNSANVHAEEDVELSDGPTFDVPLYCPRTGGMPLSVEFSRRIELRDWLAVQSPLTQATHYLFHFDWAMSIRMRFTQARAPGARTLAWVDPRRYRAPLYYRWRIVAPGSGLMGETLTTDDQVRMGMGVQNPRFGRANEFGEPVIRQLPASALALA